MSESASPSGRDGGSGADANVGNGRLVEYLEEQEISVPGDLSIVAFDDSELAAVMRPQLTIISRPVDDLARSASRLVASLLANPNSSPHVEIVYPTLVVRGSTGPPRAALGARST